jgi:hypothetical protein
MFPSPDNQMVVAPVPVVSQPYADGEAGAESAENAAIIIDGVPRIKGHIDDIGAGWLNLDRSFVGDDVFLGCALQIALALGEQTEALNGVHDLLLLI